MPNPLQSRIVPTGGIPVHVASVVIADPLDILCDDNAPLEHRLHEAFRKMAPDQLLDYIRAKLVVLEDELKNMRSLEGPGRNLDAVVEQMPEGQEVAAPSDLESNLDK